MSSSIVDSPVSGSQISDDLSSLDELLKNEKIFGTDLTKNGMADLVKSYFAELSSGKGAVTQTLEKYLNA